MHTFTRFALTAGFCLAPTILAQEPAREMSCDEQHWDGDRITHCEINESTIPAAQHIAVDGGVNGGVRVRGWLKNEILVRAQVQTHA